MARYLVEPKGRVKTAAFPPFPPDGEQSDTSGVKRNIPKDHEFQARALKPLSKALWASTVALGHALTAYRHLSRLKSATVSPDGLMGGRGYVMKLSEMRQKLYEASEALSSISDTIFDEINAPHWKPKLAQLDAGDKEDVERFIEEAQDVMENPEAEAEEEIKEIEAGDADGDEGDEEEDDDDDSSAEEDSSSLPGVEAFQPESIPEKGRRAKLATQVVRPCGMSERAWVQYFYSTQAREEQPDATRVAGMIYVKPANSSQPVSELPGGPRVDHLGPGTGSGEYGDFSEAETLVPTAEHGEGYDYPSEWENDLSRAANSNVPDAVTEDTATQGWDFGIGYGARGEGAGGYGNPSGEGTGGKGVWGPHSGLPGSPPQSTGDTTHLVVDEATNRRAASEALYGKLPQDAAGQVARSDYYEGAKDNLVSVGSSEMPHEDAPKAESGQRLLNTYYTTEDPRTNYERYDFTTHTLRQPGGLYPGQNHQEPFAPDGEATR